MGYKPRQKNGITRQTIIMKRITVFSILAVFSIIFWHPSRAQSPDRLSGQVLAAMKKATGFMADSASENGGYVSHYLPDFSRRWGELEAYSTMVWVQDPGTVSMGNTFLDAWMATGDRYYYEQAQKAANALIWGQLPSGGWNYFINFGGMNSSLRWYHTLGANAWRMEEFQHYYGNATFDDETTTGAAMFLLRFYLAGLDPAYKAPLDKAIAFILKSQYPLGGWPQRYPISHDFHKNGDPDYTSFYTFNDNIQWENIRFLVACYATLNDHDHYYTGGDTRLLDAIRRAMNFVMISQGPRPYAGWAQQYTMDLKPAAARSYEPASLDPGYTATNVEILLKCYEMTGDRRYLQRIGDAISWLKQAKLSGTKRDGVNIYPKFVNPQTGKPMYTHREGSDVVFGHYYVDADSTRTVAHYGNFRAINLGAIEADYEQVSKESQAEATVGSPLIPAATHQQSLIARYKDVMDYLSLRKGPGRPGARSREQIKKIVGSLDDRGRWLTTGLNTSHPYQGRPTAEDAHTHRYMTTIVGDAYDTSPYRDTTGQRYISTALYQRNMRTLISWLMTQKR